MRVGTQGIYARVLWTQLLQQIRWFRDIGFTKPRDPVFPTRVDYDEAVVKELQELGRASDEAKEIYESFATGLVDSSRRLVDLALSQSFSLEKQLISVVYVADGEELSESFADSKDSAHHILELRFGAHGLKLRGDYLLKLLRLYRLHTAKETTLLDQIFLRRVFCVVQRYETLSGSSEGYQVMLIPYPVRLIHLP